MQTFSSELWEGREAEEVKPSTILGQLYGPVGPAVEDGKWRQRSEPQVSPGLLSCPASLIRSTPTFAMSVYPASFHRDTTE